VLIWRPSLRAAWRWVGGWWSWRNGACDIHSLTYVGKVQVALLICPLSCLGAKQIQAHACVHCIWFSAMRSHSQAALTFAGQHVDTSAIAADRVRPPEGPGHIVEHRVVWPAETSIILIGVKPQPPVVPLRLHHLNVRDALWEGMSGPHRLPNRQGLTIGKAASRRKTIIKKITQVDACSELLRVLPS